MEQQIRVGYCKHCKKMVKFIQHADYKNRWVCGTRGCNNWVEDPAKEKPPIPKFDYTKVNGHRFYPTFELNDLGGYKNGRNTS